MGMVLGQHLRQAVLPGGRQAALREAGRGDPRRVPRAHRAARLDERRDARPRRWPKLAAVTPKVGYPDKWKDYSALVDRPRLVLRQRDDAARWQFDDMPGEVRQAGRPHRVGHDAADLQRLLQPVEQRDRAAGGDLHPARACRMRRSTTRWSTATPARRTIGHEITHGFDDQGRQFDAKGNLKDWWTAEDAERVQRARAQVMVKQFNALRAAAGPAHQRQGEPRREHRRLRRHAARPGRLQEDRAVQEGRDDRRPHADAALLPRLCARLDDPAARGAPAPRAC